MTTSPTTTAPPDDVATYDVLVEILGELVTIRRLLEARDGAVSMETTTRSATSRHHACPRTNPSRLKKACAGALQAHGSSAGDLREGSRIAPGGIRTPASESLFHAEVRKAADEETSGTVRKAVVGASSGATANTISMTPPRWIAMALMARIIRRDVGGSSFRLSHVVRR